MRQPLFDFGNGLSRIQMFGAYFCTVHNGMASIQLESIIQFGQTFLGGSISGILNPTIRLHENRGSQILVGIPPVRWACRRTACTKNTLVHAIQFGAILLCLQVFGLTFGFGMFGLQPRLDRTILFVEISHVGNQIFNNVHVRKRVNLDGLLGVIINVGKTGQGVGPVNVHGAGSTDSLAARSAKCQGRILFIFDLDESIQDHGSAVIKVDGVGAQIWLLALFRVPAIDFEVFYLFIGRRSGSGSFEGRFCGQATTSEIRGLWNQAIKSNQIARTNEIYVR